MKNPREMILKGVMSLVTQNFEDVVFTDYLEHHSSWEIGQHVYIETPTKYWEGKVVYGDESGVILRDVVSVQTTGSTQTHYETGPERSENLPEGQMVALSAAAMIMVAPIKR